MAGRHADSEELAQLAMESPVAPEVVAHVASCPECTKDLSLLKSLLDAEGPDSPSIAADTAVPVEEPAALDEAMADGNDARPVEGPAETQRPAPTTPVPSAEATGTSGINAAALVLALVIFVGAALLAFFALR